MDAFVAVIRCQSTNLAAEALQLTQPAITRRVQNFEEDLGATLLDRTLPKGLNQAQQWDSKTYGIGAQILANLNVKKMRVLGKPSSFTGLTGFGLEVAGFEMPDEV